VDHPNVAYVVHLDSPMSMTEFTQGSGRAGRGGEPALSLTLVPYHKKAPLLAEENCEGKQAMLRWLSTRHCRRCQQSDFLDGSQQDCQDVQGLYCDNCLAVPGPKPRQETRWDGILNLLCKSVCSCVAKSDTDV
jgi:superfamily II DNA helicase RecQ